MKKKIVFEPSDIMAKAIIEPPTSAVNNLPKWLTEMPIVPNNKRVVVKGRLNTTVKACMPFVDSMSAGYIQKTWCDIEISDNGRRFNYSSDPQPIDVRNYEHNNRIPISEDFYPYEYLWKVPFQALTSMGSSCLFVHPLNRLDLPFFTLSGIVDTDSSIFSPWGSMPFYIKKGFEGIIPCGTPMFQIIPFQRIDWKTDKPSLTDEEKIQREYSVYRYFTGGYAKLHRKKKNWE